MYQQQIDWEALIEANDLMFPIKPKPSVISRQLSVDSNIVIAPQRESLQTRPLPYYPTEQWDAFKAEAQQRLPERHRHSKRLKKTAVMWILEPIDDTITDWTPATYQRVSQTLGGRVELHWSTPKDAPQGVDIDAWGREYVSTHSNSLEVRNKHGEVIAKFVGNSDVLNPI